MIEWPNRLDNEVGELVSGVIPVLAVVAFYSGYDLHHLKLLEQLLRPTVAFPEALDTGVAGKPLRGRAKQMEDLETVMGHREQHHSAEKLDLVGGKGYPAMHPNQGIGVVLGSFSS